MKGLIIYNQFLISAKFSEINVLYADAAKRLGIGIDMRSNAELAVRLPVDKSDRPDYDFALFLDKDVRLAEHLEGLGLRLFNNAAAIAACDDKSLMYAALSRAGLPFPHTVIAPFAYNNLGYTDYNFLGTVIKLLGFPLVVKECFGSFGAQVYLASDSRELKTIVRRIGNKPHLYQRFVAESAGSDIRINVVGGRVVAAMRRRNLGDFRSNISRGGTASPYAPDSAETGLALAACNALGVDFGGVDIFYSDGVPIVCEVNSNCHIKSIMDATGISVADLVMKYIFESCGSRQ
ncbi:MAG: RimK family alpha-L-glutamate ligase [Clostridiales bacterium]|jgi:RimK family alpha-L-glutamate ligase|nr:RimK family alpha-L-glutamate ligase [Clostridiales bacterium]